MALCGASSPQSSTALLRSAFVASAPRPTYLKGLGFDDVDIIGCPSMFLDGPTLERPPAS